MGALLVKIWDSSPDLKLLNLPSRQLMVSMLDSLKGSKVRARLEDTDPSVRDTPPATMTAESHQEGRLACPGQLQPYRRLESYNDQKRQVHDCSKAVTQLQLASTDS